MPADDLILNVRQIEGYPPVTSAQPIDAILIQRGGLGGPYMSIDPLVLVGTALASGGDMTIGAKLSVQLVQGGSLQFSNAVINQFNSQQAFADTLSALWATFDTVNAATATFVSAQIDGLSVSGDAQVGGTLNAANAVVQSNLTVGGGCAFGYLSVSQTLDAANLNVSGLADVGNLVVNGAFAVSSGQATVAGFPIVTTGNVAMSGLAPLFSPTFTGLPTAPTPPVGPTPPSDNSTLIATTAFVHGVVNQLGNQFAPLASPAFSGLPTAPTALPGTSTGQLATTAFVQAAVTGSVTGVASFNTRTGAVTLQLADITAVGGAPLVSPIFTGSPSAPTPVTGNSSQLLATTAFVANTVAAIDAGVATFNGRSGVVTMLTSDITGAGGALASNAGVSSFNGRTGAISLTSNDVSAAGAVSANSPALTGVPTAPTATPSTLSSTQIATTAFVQAALAAIGAVNSFNGRTGAVALTTADVTGVGGATTTSVNNALAAYLPLTGGTLTGNLIIASLSPANPTFIANKQTGTGGVSAGFVGATAGVNRWALILGNTTAETGGGTGVGGSDFQLNRFNNAGTFIDVPIGVSRGNGVTTFSQAIVNGPSDRRLKENIQPIEDALDKVDQLDGVSFNMIGETAVKLGLIAQDVQPIVPEVIQPFERFSESGSQEFFAIDYPQLVALLIEAVKALTVRVRALEATS